MGEARHVERVGKAYRVTDKVNIPERRTSCSGGSTWSRRCEEVGGVGRWSAVGSGDLAEAVQNTRQFIASSVDGARGFRVLRARLRTY
jgi:hypothetical protein